MPQPQILIAETQYFIALDVEHLLDAAISCDIHIVPLNALADALEKQRFDIAIIEAEARTTVNIQRAAMIEAKGATVIFLSTYAVNEPDPVHVGSRLQVQKPLIHQELLGVVRRVLKQLPGSDSESLLDNS